MDLLEYINKIMPGNNTVNQNQDILVSNREFFKGLGPLLKRHSNRVIANYIACSVLEDSFDFMPHHDYRSIRRMMSIKASMKPNKCVEHVIR